MKRRMLKRYNKTEQGYALVLTLALIAVTGISLTAYTVLTANNAATAVNSGNSTAGYYAAEAALNSRASQVRAKFIGFNKPQGESPNDQAPCKSGNNGSGDLKCETLKINGREAVSFVEELGKDEDGDGEIDPEIIEIPPGELFEGLVATESPYIVKGASYGKDNAPEAIAELTFRSRLVPLFQFAVFFDKDLEFDRTARMTLSGPVHTNANLFLDGGAQLDLQGQVTSSFDIYRGVKQQNTCNPGAVFVNDDSGNPIEVPKNSCRYQVTGTKLDPYGGRMKDQLGKMEVPTVEDLQPKKSGVYWNKADIRVVLKKEQGRRGDSASHWKPLIVKSNGDVINITCPNNALRSSFTLRDNREAQIWENPNLSGTQDNTAGNAWRVTKNTLDVNVQELLSCMHNNRGSLGISGINEDTEGGLVIFLTVDDYNSNSISNGLLRSVIGPSNGANGNRSQSNPPRFNNYGIRLFNGEELESSNPSHPKPKGISFVSDQAVFIEGDFNRPETRGQGWIPSAVLADSINILSNNWDSDQSCIRRRGWYWNDNKNLAEDYPNYVLWNYTKKINGTTWYPYQYRYFNKDYVSGNNDNKSKTPLSCRTASPTTIRTAILAGTATTGKEERALYTNENNISGGVHNMTRFHEDWGYGGKNFKYSGSLVSLDKPKHSKGPFVLDEHWYYTPPRRLWGFEEKFRRAENLPPLTPRFVYLKQDNFVRKFEQD